MISCDTTNLHFDDVFVIYYSIYGNETVSCTDYIYFSEKDANETANELNKLTPGIKHKVSTLTEYIGIYGDDMFTKGENGLRTTMSFND